MFCIFLNYCPEHLWERVVIREMASNQSHTLGNTSPMVLMLRLFFTGPVWFLLGFQLGRRLGRAAQEEDRKVVEPQPAEPGGLCHRQRRLRGRLHDQGLWVREGEPGHWFRWLLSLHWPGKLSCTTVALVYILGFHRKSCRVFHNQSTKNNLLHDTHKQDVNPRLITSNSLRSSPPKFPIFGRWGPLNTGNGQGGWELQSNHIWKPIYLPTHEAEQLKQLKGNNNVTALLRKVKNMDLLYRLWKEFHSTRRPSFDIICQMLWSSGHC